MLRNRIAASGAIMLLLTGLTAGRAVAQTATNQTPGSPLQLLQMLKRAVHSQPEPAASSVKSHRSLIARRAAHSHFAAAKRRPSPTEMASAAPATDAWTDAGVEPQVGTFVTEPVPPPAATGVGELVVAGQTVKIASPDDVNEIDMAAGDQNAQAAASAPPEAATPPPAMKSVSDLGSKSDSLTVASAPQSAASAQQAVSVGSAAWIAQVLAALGGAVAAGSAAWFLMGAAPQRTYG